MMSLWQLIQQPVGSVEAEGRIYGVVVGVVTNNKDDEGLCRVKVKFPKNVATVPLRVTHRPGSVNRSEGGKNSMLITFDLNAYTDDKAANLETTFDQSLEVRVDMEGLINFDALEAWEYPYLGYFDEEKQEWEEGCDFKSADLAVVNVIRDICKDQREKRGMSKRERVLASVEEAKKTTKDV